MLEHPGKNFQVKTSYHRLSMEERALDWRSKPPSRKYYPHARVVGLPNPIHGAGEDSGPNLWECVTRRRSIRSYGPTALTLSQVSRLLWASAGITAAFTTPHGPDFYRAAPSAGALYPIETYMVAHRVEGLEPGIYHYRVAGLDVLERPISEGSHVLEQLRTGDISAEIRAAALDQPVCAKAGAVFIWTAVIARGVWKYRERAYRYFYLEAGHMAAQLSLAAVALGLGSCPVAAFYDDEVNTLLDVDGETESAIYMTSVGHPPAGR